MIQISFFLILIQENLEPVLLMQKKGISQEQDLMVLYLTVEQIKVIICIRPTQEI